MDSYGDFKVVAINGSSRRHGQTARHLEGIIADVKKLGAKGSLIHLATSNLGFCDGKQDPRLRKDMEPVLLQLEGADGIVFGTPTYWFNMSGLMKNFIDRLTVTEMKKKWSLKWKVAGYIATGSEHEDGSMNALLGLAAATNHLGMVTFPYSMLYVRRSGPGWAKTDIRNYAKEMLKMVKMVHEHRK